jgi:hypothetical protein
LLGLAVSVAAFSCATGNAPTDLGPGDAEVDAGATTPATIDSGEPKTDSGGSNTPNDGGRPDVARPDAAVVDAPPPPQDSAPPDAEPPPPAGDDCVGTQGQQLGEPLDDECDNYFFSTFGLGANNCRPGKTDCKALNGLFTFCCYKPPSGSNCDQDYLSTPQCVPK